MGKRFKKLLSAVLSTAMIAGLLSAPIAANAADGDMKSWKFDFGATAPSGEGWTQVKSDTVYTDALGYGFLGQDKNTCAYPGVVDGYTQSVDDKTNLKDGGTGTDEYHDYVYTEDEYMPIRFALKVPNNTYYKVKVTMGYSDKDSEIYLTSERRHFVLTGETITAGNKLEKTFTAAVHSVKWKNRGGTPAEPIYEDDMLNVCVHGKNAMINAIEIQQVAKPKVVWAFGDSTVTDGATGVPWIGYNNYAGWAIAIAKYLPEDIAVVNLGEGGLSTANKDYFNVGKDDITAGDIVAFQMGHNDSSTESYLGNLDYYYNATTDKEATFVLCGPIERLSSVSTAPYNTAAQTYAAGKNTPYVSLGNLTAGMYNDLGSTKQWYTHTCLWEGTAANPKATRDASHLNDFGADMTTDMFFNALSELSTTYTALAPYVTVQASVTPAPLSDDFMKAGGSDYVMPPHDLYPLPEPGIDYKNIVDITSAQTAEVDGKEYLQSYQTVRHSDLSYITAFAAIYDADGTLVRLGHNRLEPMSKKTAETVNLVSSQNPNGLEIPAGGSYKTFVWKGAFSDKTMFCEPYSDVFSGYDYLEKDVATGAWSGATETDGAITVQANCAAYKAITEPITSGKVLMQFKLTPVSGNGTIELSPAADGNSADGITIYLNSKSGTVSTKVWGTDNKGNPAHVDNILIDSVEAGTERTFALTYDLDYGTLRVNVDGVGIMDTEIEIPEVFTFEKISPEKIASIGFTGNMTVKDLSVSTLKTEPLPTKTLTLDYDGEKGEIIRGEAAVTSSTITEPMNTKLTLTAKVKTVPDHNYVFGGWLKEDNTVYSADPELTLYLIDNLKLKPWFYEQQGVTGVADYTITSTETMIKKPTTDNVTATLDITDCKDTAGNPTAAFDHNTNVTWALKSTITGVSLSGNTLTVASNADVALEEMKDIIVEATCNNVKKTYTVTLHNCTNLIYTEDFEGGTVGEKVTGWSSKVEDRYLPLYAADGNNLYLDMQPLSSNQGTAVSTTIYDSSKQLSGIVQVKMDVLAKSPVDASHHDAGREMIVGLKDASGKYAVSIARNQTDNASKDGNYKINGIELATHPKDTDWATLNAIINYSTKTADITLTSLDGTTEYFKQENIPFASSEAVGFSGIVFETNRYSAAAKLDNIIVNQIATADVLPSVTVTPTSVDTKIGTNVDIAVTVPAGYSLTSASSSDMEIATVATSANSVTVTPVAQGESNIVIVLTSDTNPYIKLYATVPAIVRNVGTPTKVTLHYVDVDDTDNTIKEDVSITTDDEGYDLLVDGSFTVSGAKYLGVVKKSTGDADGSFYLYELDSEATGSLTIDSLVAENNELTLKYKKAAGTYLAYEDNELLTTADLKDNGWSGDIAALTVKNSADYGNYIYLKDPNGNDAKGIKYAFPETLNPTKKYVYEMDFAMVKGNTTNTANLDVIAADTTLSSNTASEKYLFKLATDIQTYSNTKSVDWFINGSTTDKITLAQSGVNSAEWAHLKLVVDPTTKSVAATVTQKGTPLLEKTYTVESGCKITGFVNQQAKNYPNSSFDNIKLYYPDEEPIE